MDKTKTSNLIQCQVKIELETEKQKLTSFLHSQLLYLLFHAKQQRKMRNGGLQSVLAAVPFCLSFVLALFQTAPLCVLPMISRSSLVSPQTATSFRKHPPALAWGPLHCRGGCAATLPLPKPCHLN